jgi:hypothetical protein
MGRSFPTVRSSRVLKEVTDPPSVVIDLRNVLLKTDQTRIPVTSRTVIEVRVIQYQGT